MTTGLLPQERGPAAAGAPSRSAGRPRALADFTADARTVLLAGLAVAVGVLGALAAFVLVKLILLATNLVWFQRLSDANVTMGQVHRSLWVVAAPVVGGLLIGLMARYGSPKIRGHGIPEAIETILIGNSRIDVKVALLKPLSSAVAIGTGGPFGAEGPIIMTGGALGSLFAQFFHLSSAERKTLLVAGAAAGMTGIFGTPMAAVLLAVELLLFEWKPRSFIPVSVAALVAIAARPFLFGAGPIFPFAAIPHLPWWGFGLCAGIGICAGLLSGLLTLLLYRVEDLFEHIPIHWMWWPAIGGLIVGMGGLIEPRALGVGYDVISDLLNDRMVVGAVVLVLLVKSTIWLVALASGTSGGVLAPLLIFGGAMGWLIGLWLPGSAGFWALLGMAATLGGTMRAPLTGAIFALELTGGFTGLPYLLTGTVFAYAVTVLLLKRSILTEKIARRGQHITREYTVDPFELTRAGEIMVTEVETLPATMTLGEATTLFMSPDNLHLGYPVVDADGRLVGIVTRSDALRWRVAVDGGCETLADHVSDAAQPRVQADDVIAHVVDLMIELDLGLVPVVERGTDRLRGIITRKDLLSIRRSANTLERQRNRFYGRRQRTSVSVT